MSECRESGVQCGVGVGGWGIGLLPRAPAHPSDCHVLLDTKKEGGYGKQGEKRAWSEAGVKKSATPRGATLPRSHHTHPPRVQLTTATAGPTHVPHPLPTPHPLLPALQMCTDGVNCKRRVCFFAHFDSELRKGEADPVLLGFPAHPDLAAAGGGERAGVGRPRGGWVGHAAAGQCTGCSVAAGQGRGGSRAGETGWATR